MIPVYAVVPVRELQDVRVEGCLGHWVAEVEDIDMHAWVPIQ